MALVTQEFVDDEGGLDFDEEADERDEFEIEKLIEEFIDEAPIRHNVYVDSDGEGEADVPERDRTHIRRGDGRLYRNQTFYNGVAFKEAVLDYALRSGRNLKQYRYDKDKIGFKCVGGLSKEGDGEREGEGQGEGKGKGKGKVKGDGDGEGGNCPWQVYASILPKSNVWKIRILEDKHTCVRNGQCEMVKVPVIARLFLDKIREEPDYFLPMKIQETIREKWNIIVSRPQCQSARRKALRWIETEYDHQFARLRDYAAELQHSNEHSIVEIETLKNADGVEEFNRMFICFDQLRRSWKETCRPLIGLDGCFLKSKIKGQLLVALGRDANNCIYPVAWGVVQVENSPKWIWFVNKLKDALDLKDGDGFIMVSDRQKGLIKAIQLELPKMEHRMCVRHIYGNLKKKHGQKTGMKPLLWHLAWSYNESEYKERLDRIFCYDSGVYEDVMKTNPKSWCRAFYKLGNFCEDVENNFTESFNNTINKAREKPFVPMLETIRRLAMARIAKRSATSHAHKALCTPYAIDFLAAEYENAKECIVTRSTNGMYESTLSGCSYRVNLEKQTCSCRKWEICGIPCDHAYGVIMVKKLHAEDFVCSWFRTCLWRRNYTNGLTPVRGARFWPRTSAADVHIPPEPAQPGRKKITKADKKRKRGVNESPTKKQPKEKKRIMHCGVCGSADHNCRFHKKNQPSQASEGVSQAMD